MSRSVISLCLFSMAILAQTPGPMNLVDLINVPQITDPVRRGSGRQTEKRRRELAGYTSKESCGEVCKLHYLK